MYCEKGIAKKAKAAFAIVPRRSYRADLRNGDGVGGWGWVNCQNPVAMLSTVGPRLARSYLRFDNGWRDHVPETSFATMISRRGAGPMAWVG